MVNHRHSIRRRNKRSRRSKRGGGGTPDYEALEKGQKYGEDITAPYTYQYSASDTKKVTSYNPEEQVTKEEVERFFSAPSDEMSQKTKRDKADKEFSKLTKLYEDDIKRQNDVIALQKSLQHPMTADELFSKPTKTSCDKEDYNCTIMGGRKSRKYKRHSKNRKSRKNRKGRKSRRYYK